MDIERIIGGVMLLAFCGKCLKEGVTPTDAFVIVALSWLYSKIRSITTKKELDETVAITESIQRSMVKDITQFRDELNDVSKSVSELKTYVSGVKLQENYSKGFKLK
jgi:hypothetical protein